MLYLSLKELKLVAKSRGIKATQRGIILFLRCNNNTILVKSQQS